MGQFVSTITNTIQDVAGSITKMVTDTGATIDQLTGIIKQCTPPLLQNVSFITEDSGDVNDLLTESINQITTSTSTYFTKVYPNDTPAGTDKGVVSGYKNNGDLKTVIKQLNTSFSSWNLPVDPTTINSIAQSIQTEVNAQQGAAGTARGVHYVNRNQCFHWAVGYGLFVIDSGTNNQGLIYAFTISFNLAG